MTTAEEWSRRCYDGATWTPDSWIELQVKDFIELVQRIQEDAQQNTVAAKPDSERCRAKSD